MKQVTIIKNNGVGELFDSAKLIQSLKEAGAEKAVIDKVLRHVEEELHDGMTTKAIYEHAFFLLRKLESPVAARYSLKKAIADLGPTGFPFEEYVAEIFKSRGYKTLTDQMVFGSCVPHEIDVVAWNDKKLIMAEIKFHNDTSTKTDLKVALYVKARVDDLKANVFNYDKERRLDEGWLITNTKFTDTAVHYGNCQNLKMISWNYPEKGNLRELIQDAELHPLTCLTSLSGSEKTTLLAQKIVLCRDLQKNHRLLESINIKGERLRKTLDEIAYLTNQK